MFSMVVVYIVRCLWSLVYYGGGFIGLPVGCGLLGYADSIGIAFGVGWMNGVWLIVY